MHQQCLRTAFREIHTVTNMCTAWSNIILLLSGPLVLDWLSCRAAGLCCSCYSTVWWWRRRSSLLLRCIALWWFLLQMLQIVIRVQSLALCLFKHLKHRFNSRICLYLSSKERVRNSLHVARVCPVLLWCSENFTLVCSFAESFAVDYLTAVYIT